MLKAAVVKEGSYFENAAYNTPNVASIICDVPPMPKGLAPRKKMSRERDK
jgi:hypothetical protein